MPQMQMYSPEWWQGYLRNAQLAVHKAQTAGDQANAARYMEAVEHATEELKHAEINAAGMNGGNMDRGHELGQPSGNIPADPAMLSAGAAIGTLPYDIKDLAKVGYGLAKMSGKGLLKTGAKMLGKTVEDRPSIANPEGLGIWPKIKYGLKDLADPFNPHSHNPNITLKGDLTEGAVLPTGSLTPETARFPQGGTYRNSEGLISPYDAMKIDRRADPLIIEAMNVGKKGLPASQRMGPQITPKRIPGIPSN